MHPSLQPVAPAPYGLAPALPVPPEARPVPLDTPKVHHIPSWAGFSDPQRLAFLRRIVAHAGRDPRIATLAVKILREAHVEPRDYKGQSAAILKWVQENVYYVNEPGERLQDPLYTLRVGYGDCDDLAILLASLYESVRLGWRFVLSGIVQQTGQKVRYVEGEGQPHPGAQWSHIYVKVGWPPFQPKKWEYAEPTLKRAPLGWDVVGDGRGRAVIPEMQYGAAADASDPAATTVAPAPANEPIFTPAFKRDLTMHVIKMVASGVATAVVSAMVFKLLPMLKANTTRRNYVRGRAGQALAVTTYR